ncbi:MAG: hypothetical protein AAGI14_09870 [Pseudomonadota bacterium]
MSKRIKSASNPFSGVVVALMVAIGLISFTAAFALMGWAPELADKSRAGEHPYSTSAIGYQGLTRLLEADGQDVTITRTADDRTYADGLLIITIPRFGFNRLDNFDVTGVSEPVLYVLPKWRGRIDRSKRSWHDDTNLLRTDAIEELLAPFDEEASLWRRRNPSLIETPFGGVKPDFENEMQVIRSESLIPVIKTSSGNLLSRMAGTQIYILSDPDVLNTFGLARRENARFALGLIEFLKPYEGAPITLDATIHGFEHTTNLLKAIFDVPFLGATLVAFATMLLIGWGSSIRTAPAVREDRAIAFGKQALADSSAGLIAMARREIGMAPGYLTAIRRSLIRQLGLPQTTDDETLTRTLNTLAKQRGRQDTFETSAEPLTQSARNREDLTDKARQLWRWRKEITHGDQ